MAGEKYYYKKILEEAESKRDTIPYMKMTLCLLILILFMAVGRVSCENLIQKSYEYEMKQ